MGSEIASSTKTEVEEGDVCRDLRSTQNFSSKEQCIWHGGWKRKKARSSGFLTGRKSWFSTIHHHFETSQMSGIKRVVMELQKKPQQTQERWIRTGL